MTISLYTDHNRRPHRTAVSLRRGGVFFCLLSLLSAISLSACQADPVPSPAPSTITLTPEFIQSSPAPTVPPSLYPALTATPQGASVGVVERVQLDARCGEQSLTFSVYLPPNYAASQEDHFPVLYLLHGLLLTDQQWIDLGVAEAADRLIQEGESAPFIIVMPWEQRGVSFESCLVDQLIPHIDSTYRTQGTRAIGGLSRGGGWAIRIGLHYPSFFDAIGLHSPANFTTAPYFDYWLDEAGWDRLPRIWIDIGDRDTLLPSTQALVTDLDLLGIPYELHVQPGDHVAEYWAANVVDYLKWYAVSWTPLHNGTTP